MHVTCTAMEKTLSMRISLGTTAKSTSSNLPASTTGAHSSTCQFLHIPVPLNTIYRKISQLPRRTRTFISDFQPITPPPHAQLHWTYMYIACMHTYTYTYTHAHDSHTASKHTNYHCSIYLLLPSLNDQQIHHHSTLTAITYNQLVDPQSSTELSKLHFLQ
jgi:hypothetical protein